MVRAANGLFGRYGLSTIFSARSGFGLSAREPRAPRVSLEDAATGCAVDDTLEDVEEDGLKQNAHDRRTASFTSRLLGPEGLGARRRVPQLPTVQDDGTFIQPGVFPLGHEAEVACRRQRP